MANQRLIALNGTGGAMVNILATLPVRTYEAKEDEAGNVQGIQVLSGLDNFQAINTFSFGSQPITVPNIQAYATKGRLWGIAAQGQAGAFNFRAADLLISARSATVNSTTLRFIEYE